DFLHFALAETARSDSGATEANAARVHRRVRIERNGVLVDGDAGGVERVFGFAAANAFGEDVDQEQMGVSAAGYDAETLSAHSHSERFRVGDNVRLVILKLELQGFKETGGFGSDDVHERAALRTR